MKSARKVIFAVCLVVLGVAGCIWFLTGQGLDRAEKWVSLVGMILSLSLGAAGAVLGWATWRASQHRESPGVTASGASSVAVDGPNSGKIDLQASGLRDGGRDAATPGKVTASGHSSAAIGGENTGDITARFDGTRRGRKR